MNTVINNDVANRLQEISAELAKTISADTESVWRLRDISRKLALIANSIEQNINLESEDEAVYKSALELIRKTKRASVGRTNENPREAQTSHSRQFPLTSATASCGTVPRAF